jgi:hypothetical protein
LNPIDYPQNNSLKINALKAQQGDNCQDFRPITAPLGLIFGLNPIATNIIAPLGLVKRWKSIGYSMGNG